MKKQALLLLGSFWGAIVIPLGYLNGLASNQVIPPWDGLHSSLAVALLAISWGGHAPALGVAKLLGILDPLYGFCIFVFPRSPLGLSADRPVRIRRFQSGRAAPEEAREGIFAPSSMNRDSPPVPVFPRGG